MKLNVYVILFLITINVIKISAMQFSTNETNTSKNHINTCEDPLFEPNQSSESIKNKEPMEKSGTYISDIFPFGPCEPEQESVDGILYPENVDALAAKLAMEVSDCIETFYNSQTAQNEYFLRMNSFNDANRVFLALNHIYAGHVKCDTETILLAHQQLAKAIPLELIYQFLTVKSQVMDSNTRLMGADHPYVKLINTFLQNVGDIHVNKVKLKLYQILPNIGDKAIIMVDKHIGIVERITQKTYSCSGWNKSGVHFSEITYDKHNKSEVIITQWNEMDIIAYVKMKPYFEMQGHPVIPLREETSRGFFVGILHHIEASFSWVVGCCCKQTGDVN